jgi:two-component system, NarL family, nitrate/nitrite response regulator NarL
LSADGQMSVMRVLIIVGVRLYCEGLAEVLRGRPCVEVVGVATDPVRGLQGGLDLRPDVVLIDTSMPEAITVVQAILSTTTATKVVALGISEEDRDVVVFAEAGVGGYVTRDATIDHLIGVIDSVARGDVSCPPRLAGHLLRHISVLAARGHVHSNDDSRLTRRELEVVDLIDCGLSNKEIARRLCIAVPTVKNHVHRILDKLELGGRAEAAAWVRANQGQSLLRLRTAHETGA